MTPADFLALVAERAAELRAAGVRKLELADMRLELDPYDGPPPAATRDPQTVEIVSDDSDPLNDPATFAMRDGSIPGFRRTRGEAE